MNVKMISKNDLGHFELVLSKNRSADLSIQAKRREEGVIERKDEFKERSRKSQTGVEARNRSADIRRQAERRAARRAITAFLIWTADGLPTDEQLLHFDKDPANAVAAFR